MSSDKKIAVVGVGGVGGYLGGMLAKTHKHVSFGVRGARLASVKENGFVLHSDFKGEIIVQPETAAPVPELPAQDVIFLCVKNYNLPEVCEELKSCVTDSTIIVPVMNGADPGDRVREYLGKGIVVDALIYIVAFANPDFSVTQQGKFANLRIGSKDKSEALQAAVETVSSILKEADIDHRVSADIEADIWKKYILNCAYNVETARYNNTIGEIRSDKKKAGEYEALVREAVLLAQAKGVHVTDEDGEAIITRFYKELAENATSSLQRDVVAGRKSELDTFSGYVVREAARLGLPAPVSAEMYEALKEITGEA